MSPEPMPDLYTPDLAPAPVLSNLSATIRCNPNMVVSAIVDIANADGATDASVEFGDTTFYGTSTPVLPLAPMSIPIFGVRPGGATHARLHTFAAGKPLATGPDMIVNCGPLPMDFPQFFVNLNKGGVAQYFLVSVSNSLLTQGYSVIVDRAGDVIWYHSTGPFSRRANDFTRMGPGLFAVYQVRSLSFEQVNLMGDVLPAKWASSATKLGADGHDIAFLDDGSAVMLGFENHDEDTTDIGGGPGTTVRRGTLDVVDASGARVSRWDSFNAVSLDELDPSNSYQTLTSSDRFNGVFIDYPHANGISISRDSGSGSLVALLGFYFTNSLYKINLTTGDVIGRIGGVFSDYDIVGDPLGGFDHQHNAHFLPNGNLLLFDNGLDHNPVETRVVEYRVDDSALPRKTLTWVWDYDLPSGLSPSGGSATRLSNGNTVVGWPDAGLIDEVDGNGTPLFELTCSWTSLYRAVPLPLEVNSIYE